jgi:hypothetical protein
MPLNDTPVMITAATYYFNLSQRLAELRAIHHTSPGMLAHAIGQEYPELTVEQVNEGGAVFVRVRSEGEPVDVAAPDAPSDPA